MVSKLRPYLIHYYPDGGVHIRCFTCEHVSRDPDDVYYRVCPKCGFLGVEGRWKWIEARGYLEQIVTAVGRYKKMRRLDGDTWHAVPTELIATEGVKGYEIGHFPRWTEEHEKGKPKVLPIERVVVIGDEDFSFGLSSEDHEPG